uniref:Uncharacterized protein MANES_10G065200 n=1 Tax=Rhizophora mucronata TaxID=61149 RepID=A0A2P2K860_RHIMU
MLLFVQDMYNQIMISQKGLQAFQLLFPRPLDLHPESNPQAQALWQRLRMPIESFQHAPAALRLPL